MIADICSGIAVIGGEVSGIKTVFDPLPASVESAHLPALWVFTGPSQQVEELSGHLPITRRIFRVQIAVLPNGQSTPQEREIRCRPLIDAVWAQFRSYPFLGGVDFVHSSRPLSDSGIVILPEFGGKFVGFELRLEVEYIEPVTYKE